MAYLALLFLVAWVSFSLLVVYNQINIINGIIYNSDVKKLNKRAFQTFLYALAATVSCILFAITAIVVIADHVKQ